MQAFSEQAVPVLPTRKRETESLAQLREHESSRLLAAPAGLRRAVSRASSRVAAPSSSDHDNEPSVFIGSAGLNSHCIWWSPDS